MPPTATLAPRRSGSAALRALGLFLAMAAALIGFGVAPTTASGESPQALTGAWDVTVTIGTGATAVSTNPHFVFAADHTLTADGPAGPDGKPQYSGTGYWNTRPDGTFALYVTHPDMPDKGQSGGSTGTITAVHVGRLYHHGRAFTTSAVAFVHHPDGTTLGPVTVSSVGHRAGPAN